VALLPGLRVQVAVPQAAALLLARSATAGLKWKDARVDAPSKEHRSERAAVLRVWLRHNRPNSRIRNVGRVQTDVGARLSLANCAERTAIIKNDAIASQLRQLAWCRAIGEVEPIATRPRPASRAFGRVLLP